ncbi:MAG: MinD/ParA family protein [bacterium]
MGVNKNLTEAKIISITSGKGGVGKTNIVINVAYSLIREQKRVLIIDADMGLADISMLLGLTHKSTILDVFTGEKELSDIIIKGPGGLEIIPTESAREELTLLDAKHMFLFKEKLKSLLYDYDVILVDTPSGIGKNVMRFNQMAQEIIVVLSPDPTSMADAYALIKILSKNYNIDQFHMLCNLINTKQEGEEIFNRLHKVVKRFLNIELIDAGYIYSDTLLMRSSRSQEMVTITHPTAKSTRCFEKLAKYINSIPCDINTELFMSNFLHLEHRRVNP